MKKSEWSDKQIEELLQHLPKVKDNQDPDELFRNISSRIQDDQIRKTRKKAWILPSAAAVAALFLLFIIGPTLINDSNGVTEESAYDMTTSENRGFSGAESKLKQEQEFAIQTNPNESTGFDNQSIMMTDVSNYSNIVQDIGTEQTLITIGLMDPFVQNIVPVSFLVSDTTKSKLELLNEIIKNLQYEDLGLEPSLLDGLLFEENNLNKLIITVPFEYKIGSSSAQVVSFMQSISETFRWMGYTEIELITPEGNQVEIDQVGPVEPIDLSTQTEVGYFVYSTEKGNTYLVPHKDTEYETIDDALTSMQNPNAEYVQPSIPIEIEIINKNETNITISFKQDEVIDEFDPNHRLMIEAILLTAKEFGYNSVTFYNTPEQIGGIVLREAGNPKRVDVPYAPNPIKLPVTN